MPIHALNKERSLASRKSSASAPIDGSTRLLAVGCALPTWSLEELRKAMRRHTIKG